MRSTVFSADPGLLRVELIKETEDVRGGSLKVDIVEAMAVVVGIMRCSA